MSGIISGSHGSDASFLNTEILSIFKELRRRKIISCILEQCIMKHPPKSEFLLR